MPRLRMSRSNFKGGYRCAALYRRHRSNMNFGRYVTKPAPESQIGDKLNEVHGRRPDHTACEDV